MRPGRSPRALKAAIGRLESRVGKGQKHCPSCRLALRTELFDARRPAPRAENTVTYRCEFCDSPIIFDLTDVPEEEREIYRLDYSITMEDEYTSRVAHAFKLWKLIYTGAPPKAAPVMKASRNGDVAPAARALLKLREEKSGLFARKDARLVAKYGTGNFPDVEALIKSAADDVQNRRQEHLEIVGIPGLADEERRLTLRAELEKVIWGRIRPETASAVEGVEQRIGRLVDDERARREAAGEEERRRERDEEEEARLRAEAEVEARLRSETEERARPVRAKYGSPKPYDEMAGMRPFDFEAYERQAAAAKHPLG